MKTQQQTLDHLKEVSTLDPSHACTIAELDADDTLDSELQYIVNQTAGRLCNDICFVDDSTRDGKRIMSYSVYYPRMTGFIDRDEQGSHADTEQAHDYVEIEITSDMTFAQVAMDLTKQVIELEGNYYGRKV